MNDRLLLGAYSNTKQEITASSSSIRTATEADGQPCLAVLMLAFSGDPICRWLWPDPQQFLAAFQPFARAFGGCAIDHGTAHYQVGFTGAALWLPPGTTPDGEIIVQVIKETVSCALQPAAFSLFEKMDVYYPQESHWHLALIGIDPARQGQGIGSALLHYALKQCDEQQVLAYLEASSPWNVVLYERHGFEALGSIQVADSPPIIPMLRTPRYRMKE